MISLWLFSLYMSPFSMMPVWFSQNSGYIPFQHKELWWWSIEQTRRSTQLLLKPLLLSMTISWHSTLYSVYPCATILTIFCSQWWSYMICLNISWCSLKVACPSLEWLQLWLLIRLDSSGNLSLNLQSFTKLCIPSNII